MLVESKDIKVIVVDSIAALVPIAELRGDFGDVTMALQARMMSQAMRKLTAKVAKNKVLLIFLNQVRSNIGGYGSPMVTTGGNALKFYASIRIDMTRGPLIKEGDKIIGSKPKIKTVKNKTAPPMQETILDLIYGEGFDKYGEIIDLGIEKELIEKSGSWFNYGELKIQGKQAFRLKLKEDNKLFKELYSKVKKERTNEI